MLNKRQIFEIHHLADQGLSAREISKHLGHCPRTVNKYLGNPETCRRQSRRQFKKLDPYVLYIDQLLSEWPNVSAVVIFQRLKEQGYTGGATAVRDYLRQKRGSRQKRKACIRFESPPGQQCQCDWGYFGTLTYGATKRKLYCMAVIECHSRLLYVEFTHSMGIMAFLRTLLNGFIFFGGTPKELVHDNLKTAVIERVGGIIRFNETYLHFLLPFHLTPCACGIRQPQSKGKVEKGGIHYVRHNFWPCRTFTGLDDVNRQAREWLEQAANKRVHQTTGQIPAERFRPDALRPLPHHLPDTRDTATGQVHHDCYFSFDSNRYTAPHWLIGKELDIKADNHQLIAVYKDKIVANHPRSWQRKQHIKNEAHMAELLRTRDKAQRDQQVAVFLSIGDEAEPFLKGLARAGKSLNRAVKQLLILCDQYGSDAVRKAIHTAMAYNAFGVDYVQNILHQNSQPLHDYAQIKLKDPALNELRLPEPNLLLYDAIALKKRRQHHEPPGNNDVQAQPTQAQDHGPKSGASHPNRTSK